MIKAGGAQQLRTAGREARRAGDEVRVHAVFARGPHDIDEVAALQRLATGQVKLQYSQLRRLGDHLPPLLRGQLLSVVAEVVRVGTVRAVQRTSVGKFG